MKIFCLGIDYTHVEIVGSFAHFSSAGETGVAEIRDTYMPAWNRIILNEPDKYDVKGMLRKAYTVYDIDMVMKMNAKIFS